MKSELCLAVFALLYCCFSIPTQNNYFQIPQTLLKVDTSSAATGNIVIDVRKLPFLQVLCFSRHKLNKATNYRTTMAGSTLQTLNLVLHHRPSEQPLILAGTIPSFPLHFVSIRTAPITISMTTLNQLHTAATERPSTCTILDFTPRASHPLILFASET
jgi:hypothetical protein